MVKMKTRVGRIVSATLLLLFSICFQVAAEDVTSSEASTYWVKGSTDKQKLTRRMALVGHNCMVSRLTDGVEVGSGSANLDALCDENLDNHYTIPSTVSATLFAGSPIIGVRDMKHYFSKDTKAGFKISGESSVLNISLLQSNYRISFYKDGKFLKTSEIEQIGYAVLGLDVGTINVGSNSLDVVAKDQPDEEYDEIALVGKDGIKASVIQGLEIYYAFVGDGEYTLTNSRIKDYDSNITVEGKSSDVARENHLTDDNLSNEVTVEAILSLGSGGYAQVMASKPNLAENEEVFPAGTEAGFVISTGGLLNVGSTPTIFLLDKNGKEIKKQAVSSKILGLDISGGEKKLSIKAPCAFSGIKFMIFGVSVGVITVAKYAFIVPEPETAGHQCEMKPTANLELCSCDSRYQLDWDKENFKDVTWSMVSTTDSNVTFDASNYMLDFSNTEAYKQESGKKEKVTVVMKITNNDDGCSQTVTINYGGTDDQQASSKKNETILANPSDGTQEYELGDGGSAGVNILTIVKNSANIISPKINAYASYFGGVSIGDSYLCSVKKKEGEISDGSKALQAGFVVTAKGSGLSADVLKMMNVRIYKNGEQVGSGIATSAIAAKLIGAEDTHKLRYSIDVPEKTDFDEIRLYSTGLLGANLNVLNIYYAYTAPKDSILDDPMEGATIVSFGNTNATIDANKTQSINVVNVGNGLTGITNCIDGNMDTATLFPVGADVAGGSVLAVKLGVTATKNKQLVIVVNKEAAGLGVKLANAMVIKTYKTGVADPINTYDDWSVLGANIITLGDKGYVFLNPKEDYDEVTITEGNGVSALSSLGVYGILLRNDKDGDGTPDADEPSDDCKQDLVFQETVNPSEKNSKKYKSDITMYFQRTFVPDAWNSLILPVDLSKKQFENAFGKDAELAKAEKLYEKTETTTDGVTEKHRIIGFELVKEGEDGRYLDANTPYIIYMTKDAVDAHKDQTYQNTWDAGDINGEIYVVDNALEGGGVTYADEGRRQKGGEFEFTDTAFPILNEWQIEDVDFMGSYDPQQEVKADSYIFNNGKMYHLTKSHKMKGFRCWLVPNREPGATAAKSFGFGINNGETTSIQGITTVESHNTAKVYNLNGQQVDMMTGVQPGIYIINGKKVVVRK